MDRELLNASLTRRLHNRSIVEGRIVLPAVPGMLDEYVVMCDRIFTAVGVEFSADERDALREAIRGQLAVAFEASPRSEIVITYDSPVGLLMNYRVQPQWSSVEAAYDAWIATREPPLFGSEPDARVWSLALEAVDPREFRILDLGAGTGRNSLALARRGHPVDAVEVTSGFAATLRSEAEREGLAVRVVERDIFDALGALRRDYELIVLSEVASDFRSVGHVRGVFELAVACLAPGGRLVMNTFIAKPGYVPDDAAIGLGQQAYTSIFTSADIDAAVAGLPLVLESDDCVYDYEFENLPRECWPPTSWYERWVNGQDVFDVDRANSPIELRWLVFRKAS